MKIVLLSVLDEDRELLISAVGYFIETFGVMMEIKLMISAEHRHSIKLEWFDIDAH